MKSVAIVYLLDEIRNSVRDLCVGLVIEKMHLLIFYRLPERFCKCVVRGITPSAHADFEVVFYQFGDIVVAGILYSAIRVVNAARRWFASFDRHFQ
jgi:hypothetical protein